MRQPICNFDGDKTRTWNGPFLRNSHGVSTSGWPFGSLERSSPQTLVQPGRSCWRKIQEFSMDASSLRDQPLPWFNLCFQFMLCLHDVATWEWWKSPKHIGSNSHHLGYLNKILYMCSIGANFETSRPLWRNGWMREGKNTGMLVDANVNVHLNICLFCNGFPFCQYVMYR